MAGHSQFKNIMHRKAAQDRKKAKVFTKLIRDIMTAARSGGGDPNGNPVLRTALEKARKESMTKDVIERAIKRGTGEVAGADYVERTYEGYGPGGVAVVVRTLTDNPTRTITGVRTAFNKHGGNVGADGAVMFQFKHVGALVYPLAVATAERMEELAIEAGADDVQSDPDEGHRVLTAPADLAVVKNAMAAALGEPESAELTFVPIQTQVVEDEAVLEALGAMVGMLEEDGDVQEVITNLAEPSI